MPASSVKPSRKTITATRARSGRSRPTARVAGGADLAPTKNSASAVSSARKIIEKPIAPSATVSEASRTLRSTTAWTSLLASDRAGADGPARERDVEREARGQHRQHEERPGGVGEAERTAGA